MFLSPKQEENNYKNKEADLWLGRFLA